MITYVTNSNLHLSFGITYVIFVTTALIDLFSKLNINTLK